MRLRRHLVVLVVLCLILGASAASAAHGSSVPAAREIGEMVRIALGHLKTFFKAVWEYEGAEIDPLGRNSPGPGDGDDPATPGADEGFQIDPLG
jgi:hypothetical protein